MATVINNPGDTVDNSSSTGVLIGILLAVLIVLLLLAFGLPYLRARGTGVPAVTSPSGVTNSAPSGVSGSGSFNVQTPNGSAQGSGNASGAASSGQ